MDSCEKSCSLYVILEFLLKGKRPKFKFPLPYYSYNEIKKKKKNCNYTTPLSEELQQYITKAS